MYGRSPDREAMATRLLRQIGCRMLLLDELHNLLATSGARQRELLNLLRYLGNELRIKVTAPPVDAAANEALVKLLAKQLDCPRNRVELVRGHTSRHKTLKLYGLAPEEVVQKLAKG